MTCSFPGIKLKPGLQMLTQRKTFLQCLYKRLRLVLWHISKGTEFHSYSATIKSPFCTMPLVLGWLNRVVKKVFCDSIYEKVPKILEREEAGRKIQKRHSRPGKARQGPEKVRGSKEVQKKIATWERECLWD